MGTENGMIPVRSTVIERIGYNPKTRLLLVAFAKAGIHGYMDVEACMFDELKNAVSKGRFFTTRIRNRYQMIRVADRSSLAAYLEQNGQPVTQGGDAMQKLVARIRPRHNAVEF